MTDTNFAGIVAELAAIHNEFPDLRFGEVVQTAIDNAKRTPNANLFDISSKAMLQALQHFHDDTTRRRAKQ